MELDAALALLSVSSFSFLLFLVSLSHESSLCVLKQEREQLLKQK